MSDLYTETDITVSGLNGQKDVDIQFMKSAIGLGEVARVKLNLKTANTGTAYTADSLSLELFQVINTSAAVPISLSKDSFYKRTGMEPAAVASGGEVFDDSDFSEPVSIANQTVGQEGQISARIIRTGGAADSVEVYTLQVWGKDNP